MKPSLDHHSPSSTIIPCNPISFLPTPFHGSRCWGHWVAEVTSNNGGWPWLARTMVHGASWCFMPIWLVPFGGLTLVVQISWTTNCLIVRGYLLSKIIAGTLIYGTLLKVSSLNVVKPNVAGTLIYVGYVKKSGFPARMVDGPRDIFVTTNWLDMSGLTTRSRQHTTFG